MANHPGNESDFKEPYLALRRNIGLLAMGLPFVVVLGALILSPHVGIQGSISAYYYTKMRNVFVGTLSATGVFLLTYNPGNFNNSYRKGHDQIFGFLAGLFAIGVALFPTTRTVLKGELSLSPDEVLVGYVHLLFAALLFLILAYFSYFLFTKSDEKHPGPDKKNRNRIYKTCGLVMLACVLLMASNQVYIYVLGKRPNPLERYSPLLTLEVLANLAFGISWIVKGNALKYYPLKIQESVNVAQKSVNELRKSANKFQQSGLKSFKKSVKRLRVQLTGGQTKERPKR